MRRGVTTRLLRVIREVSLAILVCRATDNLNRVLVCTDCTVSTQTEEQRLEGTLLSHRDLLAYRQREVCNVIDDTYCEVVLWSRECHISEYRQHLCRSCILRRKTVATTDNLWLELVTIECIYDIEVQRLAICSRLLCAVQNADCLNCLRQYVEEIFCREWTVEMNGDNTHLLATLVQEINALTQSLGYRAHCYNYAVSVLSSVVNERLVLTTCNLRYLGHSLSHHIRHCIIELVCSLASLEVDIWILGCTTSYRLLRIESALAELLQSLTVKQLCERSLVHKLNLLNLVRSTETIEEVKERNTRLEGYNVSHTCQVHNLLNRRSCQLSKTGLTSCHNILVVTED